MGAGGQDQHRAPAPDIPGHQGSVLSHHSLPELSSLEERPAWHQARPPPGPLGAPPAPSPCHPDPLRMRPSTGDAHPAGPRPCHLPVLWPGPRAAGPGGRGGAGGTAGPRAGPAPPAAAARGSGTGTGRAGAVEGPTDRWTDRWTGRERTHGWTDARTDREERRMEEGRERPGAPGPLGQVRPRWLPPEGGLTSFRRSMSLR